MKFALALAITTFLLPTASDAATANALGRPLGIRMLSDDPQIAIASQGWLYSAPQPSTGGLWTYFAFPYGTVHNAHTSMMTTWTGSVNATKLAPHSYILAGSFSTPMLNGLAKIDFSSDGRWICTGDSVPFAIMYNGSILVSKVALTTGTFEVQEMPLPATAAGLIAAIAGLAGLRRPRKPIH